MKNGIKKLSMVFLMAVYCFAIGAVTTSFDSSNIQNHSTSSQKTYISDFSTTLFCHTAESEVSVTNFNNLPVPNFKNPFVGFWSVIKTREGFLEMVFTQYTAISRNVLVKYRKSDIIFPFHYFW